MTSQTGSDIVVHVYGLLTLPEVTSQTGSNSVVHVYGLLTLPEVTSQTGSNSVVHVYGLLTLPEVTSQTGRHRYDYLTLPEVTVRYARTVFNPSRGGFPPLPPLGALGKGEEVTPQQNDVISTFIFSNDRHNKMF